MFKDRENGSKTVEKNEQPHKKTARHFNIHNLQETFQVKVYYQNLNFKGKFLLWYIIILKSDLNFFTSC